MILTDYLYLVDLNSFLTDDEINPNDFCNCSVSSKNIAAISYDCYTYILPLEKPNELIPVNSNISPCLKLTWSNDGKYLLCFYKNGLVNIFNIKTSILDSIERVYSTQINSNDIICIKAFSKTPKLCIDFEKRDSNNYFEKFYYKSYSILKNYSKISYSGFSFLTKSGVLHIIVTDYNSIKNKIEKFEFDLNLNGQINGMNCEEDRNDYELGDLSFEDDGSINVLLTNPDPSAPIYLFNVNIKFSKDGSIIEGTNQLMSSFNLGVEHPKTKSIFTTHESAKTFCVSFRSENDFIQIYKPSLLNQNVSVASYEINSHFVLINTINCPSNLIELSVPKNYVLVKDLLNNRYLNDVVNIIAVYDNGTQGFIDLQNFNQTISGILPIENDSYQHYELYSNSSKSKKIKFTQEYIVRLDQTSTGAFAVGLTNFSRLVTIRQPFFKDPNQNHQTIINHLFNLYEYSILNGDDFWDLLVITNPKLVDCLIEKLEDKFNNQLTVSLQKFYFSRHYTLMYSLYKRSHSYNNFRSQDILAKLTLNRLISLISFSVQFNLNIEQIKSVLNTTTNNVTLNQLTSNFELINQSNGFYNSLLLNQISFKNNLNEYLSDLLSVKPDSKISLNDIKQLNLNEIVNSILSRKNYQLTVNQHLKHVFQWIIDVALYLTSVAQMSRFQQSSNYFGLSLLNDLWFLNEIRKAIIFIKLLMSYNSKSTGSNFIVNSLPVLPLKSSMQKDLLSDLFNLYTKFICRIIEGSSMNDEKIIDSCLNIQTETIIRSMDELLFKLKYSWLGSSSTLWSTTLQFSVDHLFESERNKPVYPLFDIVHLIQFSRSPVTKQCVRCGNYTESMQNSSQSNSSKTNCIYLQDSISEKCLCGGYWVYSPLK